jgi:hypothetical protein
VTARTIGDAEDVLMIEDYTTKQLRGLRSLFAETAEQVDEAEQRTNALLILQYIDEELTIRKNTTPA